MKIKDMSLLSERIELDKYFQNVSGYTPVLYLVKIMFCIQICLQYTHCLNLIPLLPRRVTMHISLLKTLRNPVVKKIICII